MTASRKQLQSIQPLCPKLPIPPLRSFSQPSELTPRHHLLRRQLPSLPTPTSLRLLLDRLRDLRNRAAGATVQVRQVAVPAERDDVDDQHAQIRRDVLEVDELHPRPDHEVLGEAGRVGRVEAVADGAAFEVGHGGEEETWWVESVMHLTHQQSCLRLSPKRLQLACGYSMGSKQHRSFREGCCDRARKERGGGGTTHPY